MSFDPSRDLTTFPAHLHTRWTSPENPRGERAGAAVGDDGRKRSPCCPLPAGASRTLAEVSGHSGTVRRIWITVNDRTPQMLRGLRLEATWDGADSPAVSVPLGDFFGHTLGRMVTFQNALFSCPEGRSFNCCVPMPFRRGMKLTLNNDTDRDLAMLFYDVDYTLGDDHGPDTLYFHAYWRREAPTTRRQDYAILPPLTGRGRYLGAQLGVIADTATFFKSWWGEGEVKVYLDGDTTHATLCGTGTEDYIGTGWGQGAYAQLYQGCPLADHERYQYGFYRLHVPDPVYFHQAVRITIQQIGCWDPTTILELERAGRPLTLGDVPVDIGKAVAAKGYGIFGRHDDWCSCAYFYLDRPAHGLPALPSAAARAAGLTG